MKKYNVAILGASGAVGQQMLQVLEEYQIPVDTLLPLASARSAGEKVLFNGQEVEIKEATEDSFAALAAEKTEDEGSKENGGLYEDVYPGQMVTAFNDWCFDAGRKPGDTGIVETEYGCHVMYYSGDSDITYRTYKITEVLRTEAYNQWSEDLLANAVMTVGDSKYIRGNLVLSK